MADIWLLMSSIVLLLLICNPVKSCNHGEIRLVEVMNNFNGTPEVCMAGRWNRVCSDKLSVNKNVAVLCRQYGCGNGYRVNAQQCRNNSIKFICRGNESNIISCSILDNTNCSLVDECFSVHCSLCQVPPDLVEYGSEIEEQVPMVDDGSSSVIEIPSYSFFGEDQTTLYVNTNGVVSFGEQFTGFSPQSLPLSVNNIPMIFPFWRDVDIRCTGGGKIYYRVAYDVSTLQQAKLLVQEYVGDFYPTFAFIATWHQVAQFPCSSSESRNTFQTILLSDGQISIIVLLYKDVEWGPRAQIGFNAGDGNRSFTVPGGLTPATLYLQSMSNVGRPGLFVYQVQSTEVGVINSPTQLVISQIFQTSLQLRWASGHNGAIRFNVYCYHPCCPYCSHLQSVETVTTTNTAVTVNGLTPFTEYECCVTAIKSIGESECSEEVRHSTLPARPTKPVDIIVVNTNRTSITLKWSRPEYVNGTLFYNQIKCSQSLNDFQLSQVNIETGIVSNLRPFTNYTCCVSATNLAGEGDQNCVETRTEQVPPTEPQQVTVISAQSVSLKLTWSEPAESYGRILFYSINCTSHTHTVTEEAYNNIVNVSGLTPNTNYTCCVSATNQVGEGGQNCVESRTEQAPPTEPQQVSVVSVQSVSLKLTWSEPAESYGRILFYSINCTSPTHTVTEEAYNNIVNVSGLTPNTNYTCCVSAWNSIGMGQLECIGAKTEFVDESGNSEADIQLVTTVSAGVLSSTILILVVVVLCCCCYKKRLNKLRNCPNEPSIRQANTCTDSTLDPMYDVPGGIELNLKINTPASSTLPNNGRLHRREYREEVEMRYEKPVLMSTTNPRTKKPLAPPNHTSHKNPSIQTDDERIYQPLVPRKTYKGVQETSAYQDLTFETREPKGSGVVNNSENQYDVVEGREEENPYEPVSFREYGSEMGSSQPQQSENIYKYPVTMPK